MYSNFTKKPELFTNEFDVINSSKTNLKTITNKEGESHDLFEFWVSDEGKEVHCIAWDDTANALKKAFEKEVTKISMTYKRRKNKYTENIDYSIQKYEIIA